MKKLVVEWDQGLHSGGLVVEEQAWPLLALSSVLGWGWVVRVLPFRVWNRLMLQAGRGTRVLIRVPVDHGCDVAEALWGNQVCWHRDDDGSEP